MISKIPVTCSISGGTKEPKRKYYIRSLHNVVDQSDIILVVLDARDPEGCRSRLVEEQVRRRELEGKKLVSVLNKIGRFLNRLLIYCSHKNATRKLLDLIPRLNNAQRTTFSVFRITTPTHQHRIFNSFITQLLTAFKPKACHRSMEWLATPM